MIPESLSKRPEDMTPEELETAIGWQLDHLKNCGQPHRFMLTGQTTRIEFLKMLDERCAAIPQDTEA